MGTERENITLHAHDIVKEDELEIYNETRCQDRSNVSPTTKECPVGSTKAQETPMPLIDGCSGVYCAAK